MIVIIIIIIDFTRCPCSWRLSGGLLTSPERSIRAEKKFITDRSSSGKIELPSPMYRQSESTVRYQCVWRHNQRVFNPTKFAWSNHKSVASTHRTMYIGFSQPTSRKKAPALPPRRWCRTLSPPRCVSSSSMTASCQETRCAQQLRLQDFQVLCVCMVKLTRSPQQQKKRWSLSCRIERLYIERQADSDVCGHATL